MKLSVKKSWSAVHCRGGEVLRVTHAHQVPVSTYDNQPDREMQRPTSDDGAGEGRMPFKPRAFDFAWETADVGDLAIQIVAVKTSNLLGYGYLSGRAMNLIRYVSQNEDIGSWFESAKGIRLNLYPPAADYPVEAFVGSMMRVKYGGAALAAFDQWVSDMEQMQACAGGVVQSYSYHPHHEGVEPPPATTPIFGSVRFGKKRRTTLHLQPPHQKSDYACQPFFHDLVLSSPCLEKVEFLMDPSELDGPTPFEVGPRS